MRAAELVNLSGYKTLKIEDADRRNQIGHFLNSPLIKIAWQQVRRAPNLYFKIVRYNLIENYSIPDNCESIME